MTTETTKEPVEKEAATSEETLQKRPSDRRLILGPLIIYGLVAFVVAGIIVTTAIVIDKEYNQIDNQVADLKLELEQQQAEQLTEPNAIQTSESTEEPRIEETSRVNNANEAVEITTLEADTTIATAKATTPAETTPLQLSPPVQVTPPAAAPITSAVTIPEQITGEDAFDPRKRMQTRIAEHNELMARQDQEHLKTFKASQAKQIEWLREQLVKQQKRIDDIEKRNLETYEMREAAIKRMQDAREQSLNRI